MANILDREPYYLYCLFMLSTSVQQTIQTYSAHGFSGSGIQTG